MQILVNATINKNDPRYLFIVVFGESEEFVKIVGLEEAPLLGIFQDAIRQKLLEYLPVINLLFDGTAGRKEGRKRYFSEMNR